MIKTVNVIYLHNISYLLWRLMQIHLLQVEPPEQEVSNDSESAQLETQIVNCILCKQSLTFDQLSLHLNNKLCKYNNPVVLLDPEAVPSLVKDEGEESASSSSPQSIHSDDSPSSTKGKKRKRMSATTFAAKQRRLSCALTLENDDVELVPDEPTPFDGTYQCKLCSYTNSTRADFQAHIVEHRSLGKICLPTISK